MKSDRKKAPELLAIALLAGAVVYGCGGGASGGPPPPPPPPPAPLSINTTTPMPLGLRGTAYTAKLSATGGVPPYTWSTQLLGIPGLTLQTDGTLTGTPTQAATYGPVFQVQDSRGSNASATVEIDILAPLVFNAPGGALGPGNIGVSYFSYVLVNGGVPPYTFSIPQGALPPGITLDVGHEAITGTPTAPGNYSFTINVTESSSLHLAVAQAYTLVIQNNLVVPNPDLPQGVQNDPYSHQVQVYGGTPPYHYAVSSPVAALPPGISLDTTTGTLNGTPTTTGSYAFFIQVTDSANPPTTITPEQFLTVNPPLTSTTKSLPDSERGFNYYASISLNGGLPPYTASVISGALPGGLNITSFNGIGFTVQGSPTTDGLFQFTLQFSDSYSPADKITQNFQVRISDPLVLNGPNADQLVVGQSLAVSFPATGGYPPYTWKASDIPPGFTFDPTAGTLSGTATTANPTGIPSVGVTVTDSSSPPLQTGYIFFTLNVYGILGITTVSLPPIATGHQTWLRPSLTGGNFPYQWSVSSGALPPGMQLSSSDGTISGTATTAGTYNLVLALSDGNTGTLHQTASQSLSFVVKAPAQMTRNDSIAQAVPISNLSLVASISPFSDPSTAGPDVDFYQAQASPGTLIEIYVSANNDFLQPPNPNSLFPVVEVIDTSGKRFQTCSSQGNLNFGPYTLPCINGLKGSFGSSAYYVFQVPGTGSASVTFYVRVLDARGDARPDFLYTLGVFNLN